MQKPSRPLNLVALGIVIFSLASSCNILPNNLFGTETKKPTQLGILKKTSTNVQFVEANTIRDSSDTLLDNAIEKIAVFDSDLLWTITSGGIYASTNGANDWRKVNTPKGSFNDLSYAKDDDAKVLLCGSKNRSAAIWLSTNESELKEVYNDVTDGSFVRRCLISNIDNSMLFAVLAGTKTDEIIWSIDSGNSWQKFISLPGNVESITMTGSLLSILTTNGKYLTQRNDVRSTQFDTIELSKITDTSAHKKIQFAGGSWFVLTAQNLYRGSNLTDSMEVIQLPTNSKNYSTFDVNTTNSQELFVGVENKVFETTNGGVTWQVRSEIGDNLQEGAISSIVINPFVSQSVYIGRK